MGQHVHVGALDIWTEQVGRGPDVLLIGGLGDTIESWQFQRDGLADRYRMIAFDNCGAGRTPLPDRPVSAAVMADDAAAVLRALEVPSAHVAGFSMGSARRTGAGAPPTRARSQPRPTEYLRSLRRPLPLSARLLALAARGRTERARVLRGVFTGVYTPRAHADGSVARIVAEALAFPYRQSVQAFKRRSMSSRGTTLLTACRRLQCAPW
jgi:3-oxoadipate enol-lactonase